MNKIKLYERLGAKQFQKIVLKLEEIKFKVEKILFPNNKLYKIAEKRLERKKQTELKKVQNEEQKNKILNVYKYRKLKIKRQLVNSKNDNYHLKLINVDEFNNYLNWNKAVHKKSLIKNIIFIIFAILMVIFTNGMICGIAGVVLGLNSLSAIINFECINLQNYNLLRYNEKYKKLKKIEEKIIDRNIKKYKDANEIIAKTLEKSIDVPTVNDIIRNVKTNEQKIQILNLIEKEQKKRIKYEDDLNSNDFHK